MPLSPYLLLTLQTFPHQYALSFLFSLQEQLNWAIVVTVSVLGLFANQ